MYTEIFSLLFHLYFSFHLQTYHWRQLENLYFREKKFSIEVNEEQPQRIVTSGRSTVERKKKSSSEVKVLAWYGTPQLIKTIWNMSISQHHFYLNRKQSKVTLLTITPLIPKFKCFINKCSNSNAFRRLNSNAIDTQI